tara:strand:+ start:1277 stop:1933 length:657 start_codon:yes stop_codon:yes gene_type:complete
MAITFRANKGQGLTYGEMDTNFGSYFYSSSIDNSGTVLVLHYSSSLNVPVNIQSHRVPLLKGIGSLGADRRVAFFSGSAGLNSAEGFLVDSSGSVGIGVAEPINVLSHKLYVSGSIGATGTISQVSDERFKTNITTITGSLDRILNSRGVTFDMDGRTQVGVVAQEVSSSIPEVVFEDKEGWLSVSYGNVVGVLIEAVKEQNARIDQLETRITNLENN